MGFLISDTDPSQTQHMKSMHKGIRHICDQCVYSANQLSNHTQHMKLMHEEIKYVCDHFENISYYPKKPASS